MKILNRAMVLAQLYNEYICLVNIEHTITFDEFKKLVSVYGLEITMGNKTEFRLAIPPEHTILGEGTTLYLNSI
jgi:hypothetical protein